MQRRQRLQNPFRKRGQRVVAQIPRWSKIIDRCGEEDNVVSLAVTMYILADTKGSTSGSPMVHVGRTNVHNPVLFMSYTTWIPIFRDLWFVQQEIGFTLYSPLYDIFVDCNHRECRTHFDFFYHPSSVSRHGGLCESQTLKCLDLWAQRRPWHVPPNASKHLFCKRASEQRILRCLERRGQLKVVHQATQYPR